MAAVTLGLGAEEIEERFEAQFKSLHLHVFNRPARTLGEVIGALGGVMAHFVATVIEENNRRIAEQLEEMGVLPDGKDSPSGESHTIN